MRIDPREVVFDPGSVADPNGKVFWWRGKVYRGVRDKAAGLYRTLFERGVIEKLFDAGLIETEITSLSLNGYELVLSHRTIPFRAYPFEWCNEMLRDAALLTCDLNLALTSLGLTTQDAHCWNILFDGATPKFVDFGSIVSAKKDSGQLPGWYKEFQDYFLYPLYLMSANQGELARRILFDLNNNVSKEAIIRLLPWTRQVQCRWNDLFNNPYKLRSLEAFLQQLRRSVEVIEFPAMRTAWSGYYDDGFPSFRPSDAWNLKHQTVFDVLLRLHPASVVDIGSNKGWYSQLAASMGSFVVAFDTDETCVRSLYADALKSRFSILPLIMDVCSPSPVGTCVAYPEYSNPSAQDRMKGEMVLALAIVHHLAFKKNLRFDRIIEKLAIFTTRWLLVEFVPPTDQYVSEWYSDEFGWYSTQSFIVELEKTFSRIEILDSFPAPRKLLLCER